ncbi:MAG: circadian phase modifier CpmA, partial [Synechococcaceae cyanobacterium]
MNPTGPTDQAPEQAPQHRLDLQRRQRLGMVEAVWGEHKSAEQIASIALRLHGAGELLLATRVAAEKAEAVMALLGEPVVQHHAEARCLTSRELPAITPERGRVAVVAGGTSDLAVGGEGP